MTAIKIWGAGTPRSLRPIWIAEELELEYELMPIGPRTGETQTPEYTRMNRKQKIPFLTDGSVRLSESVAICRYLLGAYANGNIYLPDSAEAKAKEDEWCCYIFGELDEASLYVIRRHRDLAEIYGASEQVVAAAEKYQGFSLPDLLLTTCLDWALFYGVSLPDVVSAYRDRIAQRPAYEKAMQINYPNLFGELSNGTA